MLLALANQHQNLQQFERTLAWIDFFTSTVFLMDLVYRWFFRIEGEYKSFKDYCIKNWYDFPSLISDIPGLTGAGTLSILVVARLIRVLRIFKVRPLLNLTTHHFFLHRCSVSSAYTTG